MYVTTPRPNWNSHQNFEYVIGRKSWREWPDYIAKSNHAVLAVLVYFTGQSRNLTLVVCSHFTGWSHVSESIVMHSDIIMKRKLKQRWSTIPPISTKVRCNIIYMQVHNINPSSYFEKHTSYIAKHKHQICTNSCYDDIIYQEQHLDHIYTCI